MFIDKKHASGWRAGGGGEFEWVEGGSSALTEEEMQQDTQRAMWLAYSAFHLGDYKKALDTYQTLLDKGSDDQMLHVYQGESARACPHTPSHPSTGAEMGRRAGPSSRSRVIPLPRPLAAPSRLRDPNCAYALARRRGDRYAKGRRVPRARLLPARDGLAPGGGG